MHRAQTLDQDYLSRTTADLARQRAEIHWLREQVKAKATEVHLRSDRIGLRRKQASRDTLRPTLDLSP